MSCGVEVHAADFHLRARDVRGPRSVQAELDFSGFGQILDVALLAIDLHGEINDVRGAALEAAGSGRVEVVVLEDGGGDGALLAGIAKGEGLGKADLASARVEADRDVGDVVCRARRADDAVVLGVDGRGRSSFELSGCGAGDVDGDRRDFGGLALEYAESFKNGEAVGVGVDGIFGVGLFGGADVARVAESTDNFVSACSSGAFALIREAQGSLDGGLALRARKRLAGESTNNVAERRGGVLLDLAATLRVGFLVRGDGENGRDAVELLLVLGFGGGVDVFLRLGDGLLDPLGACLADGDVAGEAGNDVVGLDDAGEHPDGQRSGRWVSAEERRAEIKLWKFRVEGSEGNRRVGVVDFGQELVTKRRGVNGDTLATKDIRADPEKTLPGICCGFADGASDGARSLQKFGHENLRFRCDANCGERSVTRRRDNFDHVPGSASEVLRRSEANCAGISWRRRGSGDLHSVHPPDERNLILVDVSVQGDGVVGEKADLLGNADDGDPRRVDWAINNHEPLGRRQNAAERGANGEVSGPGEALVEDDAVGDVLEGRQEFERASAAGGFSGFVAAEPRELTNFAWALEADFGQVDLEVEGAVGGDFAEKSADDADIGRGTCDGDAQRGRSRGRASGGVVAQRHASDGGDGVFVSWRQAEGRNVNDGALLDVNVRASVRVDDVPSHGRVDVAQSAARVGEDASSDVVPAVVEEARGQNRSDLDRDFRVVHEGTRAVAQDGGGGASAIGASVLAGLACGSAVGRASAISAARRGSRARALDETLDASTKRRAADRRVERAVAGEEIGSAVARAPATNRGLGGTLIGARRFVGSARHVGLAEEGSRRRAGARDVVRNAGAVPANLVGDEGARRSVGAVVRVIDARVADGRSLGALDGTEGRARALRWGHDAGRVPALNFVGRADDAILGALGTATSGGAEERRLSGAGRFASILAEAAAGFVAGRVRERVARMSVASSSVPHAERCHQAGFFGSDAVAGDGRGGSRRSRSSGRRGISEGHAGSADERAAAGRADSRRQLCARELKNLRIDAARRGNSGGGGRDEHAAVFSALTFAGEEEAVGVQAEAVGETATRGGARGGAELGAVASDVDVG